MFYWFKKVIKPTHNAFLLVWDLAQVCPNKHVYRWHRLTVLTLCTHMQAGLSDSSLDIVWASLESMIE